MFIEVLMENLINIFAAALMALIGVLGTLITNWLNKRNKLSTINAAQQELIFMAQQTVGELQQTVVRKLKESRTDGKLTEAEIDSLGDELVEKTMEKMCAPTLDLLNAAGVDIVALIHGAAEEWINRGKQ